MSTRTSQDPKSQLVIRSSQFATRNSQQADGWEGAIPSFGSRFTLSDAFSRHTLDTGLSELSKASSASA